MQATVPPMNVLASRRYMLLCCVLVLAVAVWAFCMIWTSGPDADSTANVLRPGLAEGDGERRTHKA